MNFPKAQMPKPRPATATAILNSAYDFAKARDWKRPASAQVSPETLALLVEERKENPDYFRKSTETVLKLVDLEIREVPGWAGAKKFEVIP